MSRIDDDRDLRTPDPITTSQRSVDQRIADLVQRRGADEETQEALDAFAGSEEFRSMQLAAREDVLSALERSPDFDAGGVDRLRRMALDGELDLPAARRREQIAMVLDPDAAPSPVTVAAASGATRPEYWHSSTLTVAGGAVTAVEMLEIAGVAAHGASGPAAVVLAAGEGVFGTAMAHRDARSLAIEMNYAHGYADEMTALTRGTAGPTPDRRGEREGIERARIVWVGLDPAERAHLREMKGPDRRAFETGLRRELERRVLDHE